ncbi:methionine--tRNA ligase [Malassezia nana]|uniref:Probable methionine--tRNA ligase, mitochondrial n=1 Tax=Malassezia nana TaxID=180528 RepID=A0AAF0J4J1_9BASI|nr:methionine--tRNA ligase [Malassezia nana]
MERRTTVRHVRQGVRTLAACARAALHSHASPPKPYYVTTPIFYVNAEPHMGHLHSSVLADVLARYAQLRHGGWSGMGQIPMQTTQPRFTTGTDEHGMKIQRVAEAQHCTPQALCDRVSERFRRRLQAQGHIYLGEHEGWYAVSDEAFYPASQVREVRRGSETVYESIETGQRVEWTREINYKFRLSHFREPLRAWLTQCPDAIQPRSMHERILAEIDAGLGDLSISRPRQRLYWGIPVPDDEAHTMYVWVDALVNYLTALEYPRSEVPEGWPADVHVVGKDIVRFHTIYWPALLMAAGLPLPRTIVAHAHWTVNKAKMSKSKGNSVNPFEAIEMYGLDTIRYYLMRIGGNIGTDADYAPALLEEHKRKYLQGQLGNLLSRILAPKIQARLAPGDHGALVQPAWTEKEHALLHALDALPATWDRHMQQFEPSKAIQAAFQALALANEHVQHTSPWAAEAPSDAIHRCVFLAMECLRVCGTLLTPVMPDAMSTLLHVLQVPTAQRTWSSLAQRPPTLPLRTDATKIQPLFPR